MLNYILCHVKLYIIYYYYLFISCNDKCTGKCRYKGSVKARKEPSNTPPQIRYKINIMQKTAKSAKIKCRSYIMVHIIPLTYRANSEEVK